MKRVTILLISFFLTLAPLTAHAGNAGDFAGGVAIGTGYAGVNTAPTDGLIIQGQTGIGVTAPADMLDINGGLGLTTTAALPMNGIYLSAANTLDFTTSGTKALEINSSGAITTGIWNGSPINLSSYATGTLPTTNGGTGVTNFTEYGVIYGNGTSALGVTATGTTGYVLTSNGSAPPTWQQLTLTTTGLTGQVGVPNGGTGDATLTSNGVLYGNGTGSVQVTAQGGTNTILTANNGAPSFSASPTIGTSVTTPLVVTTAITLNGAQVPLPPGGRLTLSSTTPVMTSDVTAAATVYYTNYVNDLVPIYNGTNWIEYSMGGQLSLALDSNSGHTGYQQSGKSFDLVIFNNSGTPQLCTGPAWSNNTTRASSIVVQNGIWTNSGSWTIKCNSTSSTNVCSANQCTYIGTMYATANGQTGMQFKPTSAAGGSANILGLYNAYNRIHIYSMERDSSTWTYAVGNVWRAANNNANNSIHWVDGLAQSPVFAVVQGSSSNNTIGSDCSFGANLDSTSGAPNTYSEYTAPTNTTANNYVTLTTSNNFLPQLGYHYIALMEYASAGTCFNNSNGAQPLIISLDM